LSGTAILGSTGRLVAYRYLISGVNLSEVLPTEGREAKGLAGLMQNPFAALASSLN